MRTYFEAVAKMVASMGLVFALLLQLDHTTSRELVVSTEALISMARKHPTGDVIYELLETRQHLEREISQLDVELAQFDTTVARRHGLHGRARKVRAHGLAESAVGIADDCIAMIEILEWRRSTYARQIGEIDALV